MLYTQCNFLLFYLLSDLGFNGQITSNSHTLQWCFAVGNNALVSHEISSCFVFVFKRKRKCLSITYSKVILLHKDVVSFM